MISLSQRVRRCALFLGLISLTACANGDHEELWLIGLDGADWDILDPLIARGDLPHLAALRRDGAWGELRSDEPMLSPILWTSIATGKTADLHGVTWFMSDAPDGTKIPVSSRNRWVRAVWNIAHEAGLASGVVGWWATWPAEPIKGFLVSDYVAWHSFGVTGRQLDAPGKTYPPELFEQTRHHFPPPESIDDALVARFVHLPAEQLRFDSTSGPYGEPISHLRQAISTTLGYVDLTLEQLERARPRLLAVYFEGTDAVEHLFTSYASPRLDWVSPEDHAAFKDVVTEYWKWQDEQLGRLLTARGPNTTIMVVSDHGFRTGDERLKELEFSIERADASHMPDGVVLLHGPSIKAGARIEGADIYDVTPTALRLMGLPVADDMAGRALESALDPVWVQSHPASRVDTYETGDWDRGDDLVLDGAEGEQMEEMLRSLGYIGDGADASSSTQGGNVEQVVNLAIVLRQQGKLVEAATQLESALGDHPENLSVRTNLAQVYAGMKRFADAEAIYRSLVQAQPGKLEFREDYALTLGRQGRTDEALREYEAGLALDPAWTVGRAGRGFALHELGRSEEALAALDAVVQDDPRFADAHYYRGLVLRATGQGDASLQAMRRAVELDPTNLTAVVQLSIMLDESGNLPPALKVLEDARQQGADDPDLGAQLGALYLKAGRVQEALSELSVVADQLQDPVVYGNYGTALGMTGDLPGAARNFEKVVQMDPGSREGIITLAQIHMQLQNPDRAESLLVDAVKRLPDDPHIHVNLGTFYHALGRLDAAEREYQTAIDLDDTVGLFHYQLAMLVGQRGDEARAQELLEKARRLDPSLPLPGGG